MVKSAYSFATKKEKVEKSPSKSPSKDASPKKEDSKDSKTPEEEETSPKKEESKDSKSPEEEEKSVTKKDDSKTPKKDLSKSESVPLNNKIIKSDSFEAISTDFLISDMGSLIWISEL